MLKDISERSQIIFISHEPNLVKFANVVIGVLKEGKESKIVALENAT
jgi:chromosome segregation ATPase